MKILNQLFANSARGTHLQPNRLLILNRKNKKYLVRQYLTPLVKAGVLEYVYPERGNSPNQAYVTLK